MPCLMTAFVIIVTFYDTVIRRNIYSAISPSKSGGKTYVNDVKIYRYSKVPIDPWK